MIAIPAAAVLLTVSGWYFFYGPGDCPNDNEAAVKEYQNNRPAISNEFVIDDNRNAIMNLLLPLWFSRFISRLADPGNRLKEYEIDKVDVGPWKDDRFLASVTFSVKPFKCSYEAWLTGNGEESEAWIRRKFLVFSIVKAGNKYQVEDVGSSP